MKILALICSKRFIVSSKRLIAIVSLWQAWSTVYFPEFNLLISKYVSIVEMPARKWSVIMIFWIIDYWLLVFSDGNMAHTWLLIESGQAKWKCCLHSHYYSSTFHSHRHRRMGWLVLLILVQLTISLCLLFSIQRKVYSIEVAQFWEA